MEFIFAYLFITGLILGCGVGLFVNAKPCTCHDPKNDNIFYVVCKATLLTPGGKTTQGRPVTVYHGSNGNYFVHYDEAQYD